MLNRLAASTKFSELRDSHSQTYLGSFFFFVLDKIHQYLQFVVTRFRLWEVEESIVDHAHRTKMQARSMLEKLWYIFLIHFFEAFYRLLEWKNKHQVFDATKEQRQGQLAIMTNGESGLAVEVMKKLFQAGMDVIVGCKDVESGEANLDQLRRDGMITGIAEVIELNLLSVESVRKFASYIARKNRPIHLLINNAEIMFSPFEITMIETEAHFQGNYLSHFYLTHLLMPSIMEAGSADTPSRIINVSSAAHFAVWTVDRDNLSVVRPEYYNPFKAYALSKYCQVVSTSFWNAKLVEEKFYVRMNTVHPGTVDTCFYAQLPYFEYYGFLIRALYKKNSEGADAIAFSAISPEVNGIGGKFLANSQIREPSAYSLEQKFQHYLWNKSFELLGMETSSETPPFNSSGFLEAFD